MAARTFSRPNIACFELPRAFSCHKMPRHAGSSTYCFLYKHLVFAGGSDDFVEGSTRGNLVQSFHLTTRNEVKRGQTDFCLFDTFAREGNFSKVNFPITRGDFPRGKDKGKGDEGAKNDENARHF